MANYARMYRWGLTPWERYGAAAAESIAAVLDREVDERPDAGRALDLGCGRGQFTPELARRGWQAVGVDLVPTAIEAAIDAAASEPAVPAGDSDDPGGEAAAEPQRAAAPRYLVGDVTDLPAELGFFDFFLDIGCFQGFDAAGRDAAGASITRRALPGATMLMLAFGPTRLRSLIGGVSRNEVEEAFPDWELLSAEPAVTAGLGWPMSTTRPQWYRLRRRH